MATLSSTRLPPGLALTGGENQELRRTIRRCRCAYVAIQGCGLPMLECLLPHIGHWPAILHGLLALASRETLRVVRSIEHYQHAVAELRAASQWHRAQHDLEHTLAAALLLTLFDFTSAEWQQHLRGMIAVINTTDPAVLAQTPVVGMATFTFAHLDISCYSLGRTDRSCKLWLSRAPLHLQQDDTPRPPTDPEITAGYPASLITVLALVSEAADDYDVYLSQCNALAAPAAQTLTSTILANRHDTRWQDVVATIGNWRAPELLLSDNEQLLAVHTAWETIRRAAYLLHSRRRGFRSVLTTPAHEDSSVLRNTYVKDIVSNVGHLLNLRKTKGYNIANAMMLPLAVVGVECSGENLPFRHEVQTMLQQLRSLFSMAHSSNLEAALCELWARYDGSLADPFSPDTRRDSAISLESCARDLHVVVPLV